MQIRQEYYNDRKAPLEVEVKVPEMRGWIVGAMKIKVGDRELEAAVQEKSIADQLYEDYVARGKTVAKVDQDS